MRVVRAADVASMRVWYLFLVRIKLPIPIPIQTRNRPTRPRPREFFCSTQARVHDLCQVHTDNVEEQRMRARDKFKSALVCAIKYAMRLKTRLNHTHKQHRLRCGVVASCSRVYWCMRFSPHMSLGVWRVVFARQFAVVSSRQGLFCTITVSRQRCAVVTICTQTDRNDVCMYVVSLICGYSVIKIDTCDVIRQDNIIITAIASSRLTQ